MSQHMEQLTEDTSNMALSELRKLITDGAFGADGRLPPERDLAGQLSIGRRSLRQALGVLEAEGTVVRRQGRGTFVSGAIGASGLDLGKISKETNPLEVMEFRLALEPAAARSAALKASQGDVESLAGLAREARDAKTPADYERANAAFHRRVVEASRNALTLSLTDTVNGMVRDMACEWLTESGHCFNQKAIYSDFHDDIVNAIASRDGEIAESLMYTHLREVQANLLNRIYPVTATNLNQPSN